MLRNTSGVGCSAERWLAIFMVACAMTVAGCAHNPGQRNLHPAQREARARAHNEPEPRRSTQLQTRLPDAALLAPQPAPDCEFRGAKVEAMDAAELARLKTEYERQCYQNAEKAARDRLNSLQGAVQHLRD
jgi:hypothetical protein